MHEHRNITIHNVTLANYKKLEAITSGTDKRHTSLYNILEDHDCIYRIYFDNGKASLNLSVNVKNYDRILQWLRTTLPKFSYGPFLKDYRNGKSNASQKSDRYSQVFTTTSSDDGSFDPSTIASTKPGNPWNRNRPMELIFDVHDTAQFPDLPMPASYTEVSQSGTNMDMHQGQQDIESIVEKMVAAQESKLQEQLTRLEERNATLEATVQMLTEKIERDINAIADKMAQTLMGPSSPFFTKADATSLLAEQHRIQESTQTQLNQILHLLNHTIGNSDDSTAQSPPRKNPQKEDTLNTPVIRNGQDEDHLMLSEQSEAVAVP